MKGIFDKVYNKQVGELSEKEQKYFNKAYDLIWNTYNRIKPLLIGIVMFSIFIRLKNRVGYDDAVFYLLIIIAVLLRNINGKIKRE